MTTDERIDKLTRSVEGLTQSVELLTSFTKDNQQMIVTIAHNLERMAQRNERLESLVADIADAVGHLIPISRDHELRIRGLESRQ